MSDPPSEIGIYVGKRKKTKSHTQPATVVCVRVCGRLGCGSVCGHPFSVCVCVFVCARVSLRARAFPCICAILCVHTSSELTQADVHLVDSRNLSSAGYASM